MAIEAIEKSNGVQRAAAVCDDCGKREVVTCDYSRKSDGSWEPNEGQVIKKMTAHNWSFVKKKLRCISCEAKRKVVPMKPKEDPPREPTRAQKRQITDMLNEVYDTEAERYRNGDTDATVAEVLDVMPGWVAQIREEFFGPDGGNQNIEELAARFDAFQEDAASIIRAAEQVTTQAQKKLAEVSAMKAELDRIKAAVGPGKLKAAGVK